MRKRYIYWQDEEMWLGYLEEFPDYWTQGETEQELQENLIDLCKDLIIDAAIATNQLEGSLLNRCPSFSTTINAPNNSISE
jgi:predicted RNase H-like HicB family nuclease